jgi:hypothetical protein
MRGAGAAKRGEQEPSRLPDLAPVIAKLERASAATGDLIGAMERRDGEIRAVAAKIGNLAARHPDLAQMAVQADEIRARQALQLIETISLAAHWAEGREALEEVAGRLQRLAEAYEDGIEEGRRRAAAERAAAEQPRPRHRHRKPHLTVLTGSAAAAAVVAASAGVTIAAHDSAQVRPWAAARPAAAAVLAGPADSAVPVPSWSAKPSAAVRSARPVPKVTASPSFTPPPPAPVPSPSVPSSPPAPDLIVPSVLHLDGNRGVITLTAGAQGATWTLDASPGLSVGLRGGVLAPGQSVQVQVFDPLGTSGWVYVSFGQQTVPVEVTSSLGNPAVALP